MLRVAIVGSLLVLARVPYYLTGHVQEDAYITFRCARNLAESGQYGFNLGERVSASTSHLSVFLAALFHVITSEHYVLAMLLVQTLALVMAASLLAAAIRHSFAACPDAKLWCILALTPSGLLVSYSGMETALLVLVICALLHALGNASSHSWLLAASFLAPWLRPDAVAYVGVLCAALSLRNRRAAVQHAVGCAAGLAALLVFNKLYFGTWLHQTIIAKSVAYRDAASVGIGPFLARLKMVFLGTPEVASMFVPIGTKYLSWLSLPSLLAVLVSIAYLLRRASRGGAPRTLLLAMSAVVFVLPAAYCAGAVVFPWYLWPSQFLAHALIIAALAAAVARLPRVSRVVTVAGYGVLLLLGIGQWVLSANIGAQDRGYRASIGEHIRSISQKDDTLLLEPAGYVPYFAQRYTWDEIGLVSPLVSARRATHGRRWWLEFLREFRPTYVLEREDILRRLTLDGHRLDDGEWEWFLGSYALVKEFVYDPSEFASSRLLRSVLRFGSATRYFLYKRRG